MDNKQDILWSVMHDFCLSSDDKNIYYRHSDHLGSANWITDQDGHAVQYLHYLPYGQMLLNQQAGGYNGSDNLRSYRFRMVRVYRQFVFWLVR